MSYFILMRHSGLFSPIVVLLGRWDVKMKRLHVTAELRNGESVCKKSVLEAPQLPHTLFPVCVHSWLAGKAHPAPPTVSRVHKVLFWLFGQQICRFTAPRGRGFVVVCVCFRDGVTAPGPVFPVEQVYRLQGQGLDKSSVFFPHSERNYILFSHSCVSLTARLMCE